MIGTTVLHKGRIVALLFEGAFFSLYPRSAAQILFLLLPCRGDPSNGREKDKDVLQYGEGLIVNIPLPEPEVAQVVEDVVQNTIIRGTKEYNKDEYITASGCRHVDAGFSGMERRRQGFLQSEEAGPDPRNFKDSADVGRWPYVTWYSHRATKYGSAH